MKVFLDHQVPALDRMDPARTAILAIHWQGDVVKPGPGMGMFHKVVEERGIIGNTAAAIAAGRRAGMTIIYANVSFYPGYADLVRNNGLFNSIPDMGCLIRGTPGVEVIDELKPEPGDFIVEHSRISAFFGTDLDTILRTRDIRTVIATGVATNVAVDHTIRDAVQLGYDAILLEDCCYSSTEEYHQAGLLTMRVLASQVTDSKAFIGRLDGA